MLPQLQAIADELRNAQRRLHRLSLDLPEERWSERPAVDRWSPVECVEHLNLTSEAFLPLIRKAIEEGERRGPESEGPFRKDLLGWLLWRVMPPPVKVMRVKTQPPFVPKNLGSPAEVRARFDRLQDEQIACLEAADGLDCQRLRVTSPFNARVSYNLYAAFAILPRHQERHIWQAEQAAVSLTHGRA